MSYPKHKSQNKKNTPPIVMIGRAWRAFVECCRAEAGADSPLTLDQRMQLAAVLGPHAEPDACHRDLSADDTAALRSFFRAPGHLVALRTLNASLFTEPIAFSDHPVRMDRVVGQYAASGPRRYGRVWLRVLDLALVIPVDFAPLTPARNFVLEQLLKRTPPPVTTNRVFRLCTDREPPVRAAADPPPSTDVIADLHRHAYDLIRGLFAAMNSDERLVVVETSNSIAKMIMRMMRDITPGPGLWSPPPTMPPSHPSSSAVVCAGNVSPPVPPMVRSPYGAP